MSSRAPSRIRPRGLLQDDPGVVDERLALRHANGGQDDLHHLSGCTIGVAPNPPFVSLAAPVDPSTFLAAHRGGVRSVSRGRILLPTTAPFPSSRLLASPRFVLARIGLQANGRSRTIDDSAVAMAVNVEAVDDHRRTSDANGRWCYRVDTSTEGAQASAELGAGTLSDVLPAICHWLPSAA